MKKLLVWVAANYDTIRYAVMADGRRSTLFGFIVESCGLFDDVSQMPEPMPLRNFNSDSGTINILTRQAALG